MRYSVLLGLLLLGWPAAGAELQFSFGDLGADGSLTNFHAEVLGGGGPAAWKLLPGEAPSAFAQLSDPAKNLAGAGSVLAQTSQNPTDERFPMFIYDGEKFRNFHFSTQFKLVSGVAEQMAGLVFRFQNTSNFYVVRVSGLGRNLRFYKVVNGVRSEPVGVACDVSSGTWHQLAVQCDGIQVGIWLDGKLAMPTLEDSTFSEGKIGFWTKSDAVTYFARASIDYTPIVPAAQVLVNSVLRQEPRILGLQIYTRGTNDTTSIVASKDPSERGEPGTDAELASIRDGTVFFGRDHGTVLITLPLHDRNGDVIAAVRLKLKSFFGETEANAVGRATLIMKLVQNFGLSADDLSN
ncbi:MAG TPA: family 16 glycoside hydrolase [Candidatus Acidoferrales bacterium]|nr:family 16 glycoside hydrolase [Candidatus Acidoferrales bacterium]